MAHIFHFKCAVKCRLQFVSIWTSLKFSSGNGLDSELVGRNGIHSASWGKKLCWFVSRFTVKPM